MTLSPPSFRTFSSRRQPRRTDASADNSFTAGDKVYCVHEAESAADVLEHARRGGFPAYSVSEVAEAAATRTSEGWGAYIEGDGRADFLLSLGQPMGDDRTEPSGRHPSIIGSAILSS